MTHDDSSNSSPLAKTSHRRAHLRLALEEKERELHDQAAVPELSDEHRAEVRELVHEILAAPVPFAVMIELLESFLEDEELSHATVYRCIEDQMAVQRYRIASRAFLKGLEAGRTAAAAE